MKQVIIENPVINSPYKEPCCHFRSSEEGITDEVIEARRQSSYFVPVPKLDKDGNPVTNKKTGEPELLDQVETIMPGKLPIFSNVENGRWAFIEINDPWNAGNAIRSHSSSVTAKREP